MSGGPAAVLDASALLALLKREPGGERVADILGLGAVIGAINWAEALSKLAEIGQDPEQVVRDLEAQGVFGRVLVVPPADDTLAREIARLRPLTLKAGLSLGDRACLALGKLLGLKVLTADKAWKALAPKVGVTVEVIR